MKQVCLITGANSETGISIAESLIDKYNLILVWHNDNSRVVSNKLLVAKTTIIQSDMTYEKAVDELLQTIYCKFSRLDLIVNCIGKNIKKPDNKIDSNCWDDVLSNNLKPILFLGRYYEKYRFNDQKGCLINFSSTAGIRGMPVSPHYIVSKAGVIALSEYYAKILAPNIRVNVIAPGFIETNGHKKNSYDNIRKSIPLKRMAKMTEIVDTVIYIASCESITGQTIVVDGGLIL